MRHAIRTCWPMLAFVPYALYGAYVLYLRWRIRK